MQLEEVAEERQTVVRCGAAKRMSVLPAMTPAFRRLEALIEICLPEIKKQMMTRHHSGRAFADVAAGKPSFPVGTPHLDHSLPPLFDVG